MNIYQDLENSLYNVINSLHPDWTVLFAFTNASEPQNPFVVIDVKRLDPCGNEYTSTPTVGVDGKKLLQTTTQDFEAQVRFEFIGKYDDQTSVAEMALMFQSEIRTPTGYAYQTSNRLSLFNIPTLRRIPVKRDTDIYMIYQLDCTVAFTSSTTDEIDYAVAATGVGIYHDAGREPDHIIVSQFVMTDGTELEPDVVVINQNTVVN